jgi:hypothetical protein
MLATVIPALRKLSGAGASVSSGASFQARIGAYLIVSDLCGLATSLTNHEHIYKLSFESRSIVDDINIVTKNGSHVYIQAKAKIDFSKTEDSHFGEVIKQFCYQYANADVSKTRLVLAVGTDCSKKVGSTARRVLQKYKLSSFEDFLKNQNAQDVQCLLDMIALASEIQSKVDPLWDDTCSKEMLRLVEIAVLSLNDDQDERVQSVFDMLAMRGCADPSLLWGRITLDALSYSSNRVAADIGLLTNPYAKYLSAFPQSKSKDVFSVTSDPIVDQDWAVGRDVFLCIVPEGSSMPHGAAILELYRYNDDGDERYTFDEDELVLAGNFRIKVIKRACSYVALTSAMHDDPTAIPGSKNFTILRANDDGGECERTLWACTRRKHINSSLQKAALTNRCVRCGAFCSSTKTRVVEVDTQNGVVAGPCHFECVRPTDRILGVIKCPFFEQHPELVDFDINDWIRLRAEGQKGLRAYKQYRTESLVRLMWRNALLQRHEEANYIVSARTKEGFRFATKRRGRVQRFTRIEAEKALETLQNAVSWGTVPMIDRRTGDLDNFLWRSKDFRIREHFVEVAEFLIELYSQIDDEFIESTCGWYAPLIYLVDQSEGKPYRLNELVPILCNPLELRDFLANWVNVGFEDREYRLRVIRDDHDFDLFVDNIRKQGLEVCLDPWFHSSENEVRLVSGGLIVDAEGAHQ